MDYYCLQKDVSPDEIEFMKNRDNFFDFSNKLNNFHDNLHRCAYAWTRSYQLIQLQRTYL